MPHAVSSSISPKDFEIMSIIRAEQDSNIQQLQAKVAGDARKRRRNIKNPKLVVAAEEKHEEQRKDAQHPDMIGFDLPFRALLLGQTGAGKTYAFVNQMLLDPRCLRHKFRRIICFSPTMEMDPVWNRVYTEDEGFVKYKDYDDEIVGQIYNEQREIFHQCRDLAEPILIFIDDNAYATRAAKNHRWLDRVCVSGRHIDISLVMLCQKLHMCSPTQREQLSNMCIWCTASAKSLEGVHENMGAMLDKKHFKHVFNQITSKQYAYMHCRKAKEGGHMQIWDGLENCLIPNVNELNALEDRVDSAYSNQQGPQNPNSTTLKINSQTSVV